MGEEKATVILLMRKFVTMQYQEQPLQIKSVSAPEGVKGKESQRTRRDSSLKSSI